MRHHEVSGEPSHFSSAAHPSGGAGSVAGAASIGSGRAHMRHAFHAGAPSCGAAVPRYSSRPSSQALAGAFAELLGSLFGSPRHDLRTTVHQNEGSKPFVRWPMEGDRKAAQTAVCHCRSRVGGESTHSQPAPARLGIGSGEAIRLWSVDADTPGSMRRLRDAVPDGGLTLEIFDRSVQSQACRPSLRAGFCCHRATGRVPIGALPSSRRHHGSDRPSGPVPSTQRVTLREANHHDDQTAQHLLQWILPCGEKSCSAWTRTVRFTSPP